MLFNLNKYYLTTNFKFKIMLYAKQTGSDKARRSSPSHCKTNCISAIIYPNLANSKLMMKRALVRSHNSMVCIEKQV